MRRSGGHHAAVLVIEDVAVVDGLAAEVLERDTHRDLAPGRNVDDIEPKRVGHRLTVEFEHLHRPHVQVEGVVHRAVVADDPLFDGLEVVLGWRLSQKGVVPKCDRIEPHERILGAEAQDEACPLDWTWSLAA
jgi:hypothetical protein